MGSKCGVCHDLESKYKCPTCELRYCSIGCYRSHKTQHASDEATRIQRDAKVRRDRPGTNQRAPRVEFTGFENDDDFKRLLSRYPLLKIQLQAIYGLTLEPGPDDARTWNKHPIFGSQHARGGIRGQTRGYGRGIRIGKGGRGRGSTAVSQEDRPRGPWTQGKGDKEALDVMKKMRSGAEDDEKAEGMREFIELCLIKFGPEKVENIQAEEQEALLR